MSHQTGIKANKDLLKIFCESKNGIYRAIKISIHNEELCCSAKILVQKNNWEQDYDNTLNTLVEESLPCYILYRFDEKISIGYTWLFITWIPEAASVRNKMMYASTKATLKSNFGTSYITDEVHATSLSEITIKEYIKSKSEDSLNKEDELENLRRLEISRELSNSSATRTFGGLDFPITDNAILGLRELTENKNNFTEFFVDIQKEIIDLSAAKNVQINNLNKEISSERPRYYIFVFEHFYDGELRKSNIFIYSMPGNVASIKEKMLYSSCKNAFIDRLILKNIPISKKIEVDDPLEINEKFLLDQLYPQSIMARPHFAKPKGPPSRGVKRLTKKKD